jgi:REP element-mobilizing transposase RayT
MPYTRIYLHAVWSTKNRKPLITKDLKSKLLNHISDNAKKKGIYIDCLNCVEDHIHVLLSLGIEQTLSKTMMLIKGESSFWINKQKIIKQKFEWQDEYFAASVSYTSIKRVRKYIANQEKHHQKITFSKEYKLFLDSHDLAITTLVHL